MRLGAVIDGGEGVKKLKKFFFFLLRELQLPVPKGSSNSGIFGMIFRHELELESQKQGRWT